MSRPCVWATIAVLFASCAVSAGAGEAEVLCSYAAFAKVVGVTPDQEPAMRRILAGLDGKLKSWDAANRSRLAALEAQLASARKGADMALTCRILNARQALKAKRAALAGPTMARLVGELNAEQRSLWEGDVLFRRMRKAFAPFRLSGAQVDELRLRCIESGRAIATVRAAGQADEIGKVRTALARDVVLNVLTDKQRERYAGRRVSRTGPKETPAQRAERIRLAVMGFAHRRLAEDMASSARAINTAVANAAAVNTRTSRTDSGRSGSDRVRRSSGGRTTTSTRAASSGGGCPPTAST